VAKNVRKRVLSIQDALSCGGQEGSDHLGIIHLDVVRPTFFYKLFYGNFFSKIGSGGRNKNKNKR
jgi:hypothetical protein